MSIAPDDAVRRLAAIVESSDDAIVSKDLDGVVTSWNRGAERIFGYTAAEMIGRSIRRIIPENRQAEEDRTLATIRRGDKVDHFETVRQHKDGSTVIVSLTVSPVRDASGRIVGASKIARDITRLKHAEASALEASRLKDEFLANLSHELRTPLNAIVGYARMLRAGIAMAEQREKAIDAIDRNAHALAQIVEDVLDISRIVSGKLRLDVRTIDLADVVRAAVDVVAPTAHAKGVRIDVDTAALAALPAIAGDADRLQQVCWNLLSNAVKFTDAGGAVRVAARRIDDRVEVSVMDTGVGIVPEFVPFVFERFRQADGGTTRERGGLGLGLAICKQLIEAHGGEVKAASAGRGHGATFTVRLPLRAVRADQPAVAAPAAPRPIAHRTHDLAGLHILIVDDDGDALALLGAILESTGARVTPVSSAAQALDAMARERPDILVADIGMPVMDGYGLIASVRAHADAAMRGMPAIALTAFARSEDRVKALTAGFQAHLPKPLEPDALMATVATLTGR